MITKSISLKRFQTKKDVYIPQSEEELIELMLRLTNKETIRGAIEWYKNKIELVDLIYFHLSDTNNGYFCLKTNYLKNNHEGHRPIHYVTLEHFDMLFKVICE